MTVRALHGPRDRLGLAGVILLGATAVSGCVLDMAGTGGRGTDTPTDELDASQEPADASEPDAPSDDEPSDDDAERDAQRPDARVADAASSRDATSDRDADAAVADAGDDADASDELRDAQASDGSSGSRDAGAPTEPRVDAAADGAIDPPVDASAPVDAAAPGCSLDGSFAMQLAYDVNWRGTSLLGLVPLLQQGSGTVKVWARVNLRERGGVGRVHGCGTALPDFASGSPRIGTELYSAYIPSAAWDQPMMPRWDLRFQLGCQTAGCTFKSDPTLTTVGARLNGTSVWPGPDGSLKNLIFEDHDGDGYPGITLRMRGPDEQSAAGVPYDLPPLAWTKSPRATRLMMALQIAFQLDGSLVSCDELAGTIFDGRVENRIKTCLARAQGGPEVACTPEQARFSDENLPEWTVTKATFRAKRIPADGSCAAVRDALP